MAKKIGRRSRRNARNFYLFILPWLVCLALFTVLPMGFSFVMSFTSAKITTLTTRPLRFIGLQNYVRIFTVDGRFLRSIANTMIYSFSKVLIGTLLALLFALLLNTKLPGRKLIRTLLYSPAVIPVVGAALLWRLLIFQDRSIMNFVLNALGLGNVDFLSPQLALATVTGISIWNGVGPSMLILLAGLQDVPQDLLDAAELDGAGSFVKFHRIVLPTIAPSLFFVIVTGLIGSFQAYAEVKLLTGGGTETVTMAMQVVDNAFALDAYGIGYASAQGWIVFCTTMIFTILFFAVSGRKRYDAAM